VLPFVVTAERFSRIFYNVDIPPIGNLTQAIEISRVTKRVHWHTGADDLTIQFRATDAFRIQLGVFS
jgi:hypothetical protein